MAENKNQHYVPRVHLKPFSLDGAGLAINLFNIDRQKAIRDAPVKSQCSGDYFYGTDAQLERAINSVENPYGEVVRALADGTAVISAQARIHLLRFVYLQYLRTEAASRKAAEMTTAMHDIPGADIPIPPLREAMKTAVQIAMVQFGETMSIVDDLKLAIIRNRTGRAFVTSDDPAVLTNRLHLQRRAKPFRSFGVRSAGSVFLLPLTPELCAIAFDSAVYQVDRRAGWIDATRETDIDLINGHQILNCMANLYFREWAHREGVASQVLTHRERRPGQRHSIVYAVLDETTEWGKRYVVTPVADLREEEEVLTHVVTNHAEPGAWPSFLRFRADARAYSNDTGAGLTRRWCLDQGFVTGSGYRKIRV